MISWITGDLVDSWQTNNKFFVLINCQGLGYEIQVIESLYFEIGGTKSHSKSIVLWLKHIKKEDSDLLFGFISKNQRDFFNEILNIKGIGSQIGISLLNKLSLNEIINAITKNDKKLISSVQGIGQKMTERIILEMKSKLVNTQNKEEELEINDYLNRNQEIGSIISDIETTLLSLNYPKKETKQICQIFVKKLKNDKVSIQGIGNLSFENLLKEAMNYLDNKNRNLVQLHSKINDR